MMVRNGKDSSQNVNTFSRSLRKNQTTVVTGDYADPRTVASDALVAEVALDSIGKRMESPCVRCHSYSCW